MKTTQALLAFGMLLTYVSYLKFSNEKYRLPLKTMLKSLSPLMVVMMPLSSLSSLTPVTVVHAKDPSVTWSSSLSPVSSDISVSTDSSWVTSSGESSNSSPLVVPVSGGLSTSSLSLSEDSTTPMAAKSEHEEKPQPQLNNQLLICIELFEFIFYKC